MSVKDNNDYLDKIVEDRLNEYLGGKSAEYSDYIYAKIDELVLQRMSKTVESLVLRALGLKYSFGEWEISSTEFRNTRLASHIYGPLQEAIIQKVGTVNIDAVASKIEKTIPKTMQDRIYNGIDSAIITRTDAVIEQMLESMIGKALREKLSAAVDKELSKKQTPSVKKKRVKKKKVPLLIKG